MALNKTLSFCNPIDASKVNPAATPWLGVRVPLIMLVVMTGFWAHGVTAQTVPADLVDIPLEDLFAANVVDADVTAVDKSRWHMSYRFTRSEFDEYRSGTDTLTYDDVLWSGPSEPRTDDNYPVVPTEIHQEVHTFLVGYEYSPTLFFRLAVPLIEQSTDHISIVPGYDEFNISSDGVGDVMALADYELGRTVNSAWRAVAGVSIPTGSIDEEGDTPRAPGDQQLPYTMQIGSGTWDLPLGIVYDKYDQYLNWGVEARAVIRTGNNDRDYRLGHKFSTGGWVRWNNLGRLRPGLRLNYRWQGEISGDDLSLLLPNPRFPYPAPVVDPTAFGGQQVDVSLFADIEVSDRWSLYAEYSKPIWLNLNGPQSAENYHFSLGLSTTF